MKLALFALLIAVPLSAHRLDEYLQATLLSLHAAWVTAEMTLTPGVAVWPELLKSIDTNGDGAVSESEQRVYADRVLRELSLIVDGHRLSPQLVSVAFPEAVELAEGRGEIRVDYDARLPEGRGARRLQLENRHESKIAAYQVNVLAPTEAGLEIVEQKRNATQSEYEVAFRQPGTSTWVPAWAGLVLLGVVVVTYHHQHG